MLGCSTAKILNNGFMNTRFFLPKLIHICKQTHLSDICIWTWYDGTTISGTHDKKIANSALCLLKCTETIRSFTSQIELLESTVEGYIKMMCEHGYIVIGRISCPRIPKWCYTESNHAHNDVFAVYRILRPQFWTKSSDGFIKWRQILIRKPHAIFSSSVPHK